MMRHDDDHPDHYANPRERHYDDLDDKRERAQEAVRGTLAARRELLLRALSLLDVSVRHLAVTTSYRASAERLRVDICDELLR